MAWYQIVVLFLGGGGIVSGVYTMFTAKVKKEGIIIENLKQIIDEVKKNHKEYKTETDEKFTNLELKISKMEIKDEIQQRAINKGYRCQFTPTNKICPVTEIMDKEVAALLKKEKDSNEKEKTA